MYEMGMQYHLIGIQDSISCFSALDLGQASVSSIEKIHLSDNSYMYLIQGPVLLEGVLPYYIIIWLPPPM